jgi:hypothetical protein
MFRLYLGLMSSRSILGRTLAGAILMVFLHGAALAGTPGGENSAAVRIESSKTSSQIQINIFNHRKIGAVVLEVRDEKGRTLYSEQGKANTTELVRKLDKTAFPKGEHTLTVSAKDFSITQVLVVE